ncbi:MAG: NAD(P)-dependent oxidoreductase [Candidatus Caldatribacteriota bacterium]|nr:NAD(P)-dependent oxidoreductase [Candidatus Caldatribacteriota bacterium]
MSKILMRVDGSCYPNPGNMGIGIVIYKDNEIIKKISEAPGYGTNNIAEYKALLRGLEELKETKAEKIEVYCDSQLVIKQINGKYKVKNKNIIPLFKQVKEVSQKIPGKILFLWDSRDNNKIADGLAKEAVLKEKSDKEGDVARGLKEKKKKSEDGQKMKILILSKMVKPKVWIKTFTDLNQKAKLNLEFIIPEGESKGDIKKYIPEAEVVIGELFNKENFKRAKKLKLIQIPFAGVDKLDFELYKNRQDIYICNIHANRHAVAEHIFALLLALAKNIVVNDNDLRSGLWHGFSTKETTLQLHGRNLGVIGLGAIGWEIAKIGYALGMKIFATKRQIDEKDLEKKKKLKFLGENKDLRKVIKKADFIVISVPLTKETRGLIGEKELKLMKGKYLINISRGAVVDEEALYKSLKEHSLAGAAIDTWYQYPDKENKKILPSRYNFHKLGNIVMSPHTAGYTDKALDENIKDVFDNIAKIYYGEEPENQVNPELEY